MSAKPSPIPTPMSLVMKTESTDGVSKVRFVATDAELHLLDGHVLLQNFTPMLDGRQLAVRREACGWSLVEPVATDRLIEIEWKASFRGVPTEMVGEWEPL